MLIVMMLMMIISYQDTNDANTLKCLVTLRITIMTIDQYDDNIFNV